MYKFYLRFSSFLFFVLLFLVNFSASAQILLGGGNNPVNVTTSHDEGAANGTQTVNGEGFLPTEIAASRFLGQATFGADLETILETSDKSFSQWLDEQFDAPTTVSVEQFTKDLTILALDSTIAMGGDPNDVYPELEFWHTAWWHHLMTSPDLLRARVALALSEIFVISELPQLEDAPLGLANYYDMLISHSFGNFRDLLGAVTMHPCMGLYLTHVNNPRSDTSLNRFPDENYAREVMQLFTIGLYELNIDGTRQLDTAGNFIPTYDNNDIGEFAKIFTGFTYGDAFLFGQNPTSELSYTIPMTMMDIWHEPGEKELLNNFVIPNRDPVDGLADVQDALDHLFTHQNVGPFIARLLIQRLVTSNPSPAYIGRVATAFNNNGQGVRGDMKAVVKAILLDPEARDCALVNDPHHGMLREPMVRYTHLCRAFNAFTGVDGLYRNRMNNFYESTAQRPLASSSVFNFFQPDYQPIGEIEQAGLVAPEFQITNSITIPGYGNLLYDWIFRTNDVMEYFSLFSNEWYSNTKMVNLDLTDELELEEVSEIGLLVERLNLILLHGQLSQETRLKLIDTLSQVPEGDEELRVRMAIFLLMLSPDYLIIR